MQCLLSSCFCTLLGLGRLRIWYAPPALSLSCLGGHERLVIFFLSSIRPSSRDWGRFLDIANNLRYGFELCVMCAESLNFGR